MTGFVIIITVLCTLLVLALFKQFTMREHVASDHEKEVFSQLRQWADLEFKKRYKIPLPPNPPTPKAIREYLKHSQLTTVARVAGSIRNGMERKVKMLRERELVQNDQKRQDFIMHRELEAKARHKKSQATVNKPAIRNFEGKFTGSALKIDGQVLHGGLAMKEHHFEFCDGGFYIDGVSVSLNPDQLRAVRNKYQTK
jgi:hypothetical protein